MKEFFEALAVVLKIGGIALAVYWAYWLVWGKINRAAGKAERDKAVARRDEGGLF